MADAVHCEDGCSALQERLQCTASEMGKTGIVIASPVLDKRIGREKEEHSGHLPVCGRCFARMGFEETNEMLRIVKPHTFANHCDGQRVIIEQLFGMGEKAVGNDVLGSTTSFHAHQVSEISARQTAFVCKIGHCGQSLSQGFRGDVVIQQFHESLHHRMIDFLASDELAVIEAETIVQ